MLVITVIINNILILITYVTLSSSLILSPSPCLLLVTVTF